MGFTEFLAENFNEFLGYTGFVNASTGNIIMIIVGAILIYLAIKKDFEPLLLIPIGLGIIIGNIPFKADAGLEVGLYEDNSVLNIFYQGVRQGWYPPLVFLGIGAMTDFSALIANPKLVLIGAAAQFGIFGAYMVALGLGFEPNQAAGIAIIGGADGPTAIFLSSKLSPNLMGAIAVCAYSYMALVPLIQPPLMRMLTTKKERLIRMKPARQVSQTERILFPIIGLLLTTFIVPSGLPLLGMLFFGNLLKESGKTTRLAKTAGSALNDIIVRNLAAHLRASYHHDKKRQGCEHQHKLNCRAIFGDVGHELFQKFRIAEFLQFSLSSSPSYQSDQNQYWYNPQQPKKYRIFKS